MRNFIPTCMISAVACLGFALSAHAQKIDVQRSGNTFYKAVCAQAVGRTAHCHAKIVTDSAGHPLVKLTPDGSGYSPADLRDAYKVTGTGSSSTLIAIVDGYGYPNAERDLGVYRSTFGLPACTTSNGCFTKLNQKGKAKNYPLQVDSWAQESALDLDMVSAMCPGCKIDLIEANDGTLANLAAAVNTAARLGAHAISNSYGYGETGSQSYESSYHHTGIAITVSSGDGGYGVQFPASSPHVTAVGGTHLVRDGSSRGWSETAWSGAGSGCSGTYAKPDWQTDTGCLNRTVADISADADPDTGVAVYGPIQRSQSGWLVLGGTSEAAPLIAGLYGVNDGKVKYGSNPYKDTADLFDVTSGSNGSCGGSYLCTAMPGYDGPTGLGTPNGSNAF